jgi:uncharacterized protein
MTTGEAGFRTQARGLARALCDEPRELIVGLRPPWNRFPVAWTPGPLARLDPARDRPAPPWPQLLITCGRRTAALSMAVRRASGGRTFTAHIQDPLAPASGFDLVVAMAHDAITGPNVIKVATALHDVTPARLAEAGARWRERLGGHAEPLAGVLLGGPTRRRPFGDDHARALIEALRRLRRDEATRLAIAPSRRTPAALIADLAAAFAGDPGVFVWTGDGDNPYLGVLALADRLVVTSDSVSMISEALATPHPVEVFGEAQNARHGQFLQRLMDDGQIGRFTGGAAPARPPFPADATAFAAQTVRRMLEARTGASG